MILEPLKPSFKRFKLINKRKLSILRALEHEIIAKIEVAGKTLDLGGGSRASYNDIIQNKGTIDSLNISPNFHPTFLADANEPWPVKSDEYDNVITFNTLEHLWNDTLALSECIRVLKPGGKLHIIVPFLYRVHGSPFDFHRHTHESWQMLLEQNGIPESAQIIEPIVWDSMATAFSFIELTRLRIFKPFALLVGILRCLFVKGDRLPKDIAIHWREWAIGYYITCTKPGA